MILQANDGWNRGRLSEFPPEFGGEIKMKWRGQKRSSNIEDRRGRGVASKGGGLSIGFILIILVVSFITGKNPLQLLETLGGSAAIAPPSHSEPTMPLDEKQFELGEFASVVLADLEDTWGEIFEGQSYRDPTLVLFNDAVQSACGMNSAAVGPFYCPGDSKVYLDLTFFSQLEHQLGAPGDFAQAYVIAHEVGHHVQNELGISAQVERARRTSSKAEGNRLSVRLELQADCYAGVWAHYAGKQGLLEPGDLEEGLRAASAIGDDTLQRAGGGRVRPESWTHGSSEQRVKWLRTGIRQGDPTACNPT